MAFFFFQAWMSLSILLAKNDFLLKLNWNNCYSEQLLICDNVPKDRIVTLESSEYVYLKDEKTFIWM